MDVVLFVFVVIGGLLLVSLLYSFNPHFCEEFVKHPIAMWQGPPLKDPALQMTWEREKKQKLRGACVGAVLSVFFVFLVFPLVTAHPPDLVDSIVSIIASPFMIFVSAHKSLKKLGKELQKKDRGEMTFKL